MTSYGPRYTKLWECLQSDLRNQGLVTDGILSSDMHLQDVCSLMLSKSLFKKLAPHGNKVADERAIKKFLAINARYPRNVMWEFDAETESESHWFDYMRGHLNACLGFQIDGVNCDLDWLREHMRPGPGSVRGADCTSNISKIFESTISVTGDNPDHLIRLYRAALSETGEWADAEMYRFRKFGFELVDGNKAFCVKKNAEISRMCCTEASLNLLMQMAYGEFIELRVREYFGFDLSTQPAINSELTRRGSLGHGFDTTDMVSASDSIWLNRVDRLLDYSFLKQGLFDTRAAMTVLPDGTKVELNMISTMGNGYTFPLQTAIFAAAVKATYDLMGIPWVVEGVRQAGVFGDDIVTHSRATLFLHKMLAKLGFEVNDAKSFHTGAFRESCGTDYWRGTNVRGVYIQTLETPQHVYSAFNRLARWSAKHSIALKGTLVYLASLAKKILVPPSESDVSGFKAPFVCTLPKVSDRYWFKYRCYAVDTQQDQQSRPEKVGDDVFDVSADSAKSFYNPHGHLIGVLAGWSTAILEQKPEPDGYQAVHGHVTSRRVPQGCEPRYKIVAKEIPFWDYDASYFPETDVESWRTGWGPLNLRRTRDRLDDDAWKRVVWEVWDR